MIPTVSVAPIAVSLKDADIDETSYRVVGKKLVQVFSDIGFCFIADHGIDKSLLGQSLENSRSFFNQPCEVKKPYMRGSASDFTGWMPLPGTTDIRLKPEAFETKLPDFKETYNLNRWAKESMFVADEIVPGFRDTFIRLIDNAELIVKRILLAFGYGLDLEDPRALWRKAEKVEAEKPETKTFSVRFAHYPRVLPGRKKDGQFWCGEHSDFGMISILFNNGVSGLQIMTKEGEYIDVPRCDDDRLILNVSDCLERLTGGYLRSVPHRVVIKEDETEDRYSVNFFADPAQDSSLDPLCGSRDEYEKNLMTWDFWMRRIDGEELNIKKGLCKAFQK